MHMHIKAYTYVHVTKGSNLIRTPPLHQKFSGFNQIFSRDGLPKVPHLADPSLTREGITQTHFNITDSCQVCITTYHSEVKRESHHATVS